MQRDSNIIVPAMPGAQEITSGSTREAQIQLLFANQRKVIKRLEAYTQAINEIAKMASGIAKRQDETDKALGEIAKRLSALEK